MSTSEFKAKLLPFDATRYLTDEKAIAEYMTAVLEAEDAGLLHLALSDIARAKGMARVAKNAELAPGSAFDKHTP